MKWKDKYSEIVDRKVTVTTRDIVSSLMKSHPALFSDELVVDWDSFDYESTDDDYGGNPLHQYPTLTFTMRKTIKNPEIPTTGTPGS